MILRAFLAELMDALGIASGNFGINAQDAQDAVVLMPCKVLKCIIIAKESEQDC